jgi:cytochrome b6-f complex iron-sulfur subunit
MERREFLEKIGAGAAFALTTTCLAACGGTQVNPSGAAPSVNFTIDLTLSAYAALKNNGGYVIVNSVVVARTLAGDYAAASSICTHEGGLVVYDSTGNRWYCGVHGAEYNLSTGAGLNSYGRNGLRIYKTSLSGSKLTVS